MGPIEGPRGRADAARSGTVAHWVSRRRALGRDSLHQMNAQRRFPTTKRRGQISDRLESDVAVAALPGLHKVAKAGELAFE